MSHTRPGNKKPRRNGERGKAARRRLEEVVDDGFRLMPKLVYDFWDHDICRFFNADGIGFDITLFEVNNRYSNNLVRISINSHKVAGADLNADGGFWLPKRNI
jgi:hypothetical protein